MDQRDQESVPRMSFAAALALLISFTALGCSSSVAYRVPTVAPEGTTARVTEQDSAECEKVAAPGIDDRGLTYASCMIERGYTSWVQQPLWSIFGMGNSAHNLNLDVQPTRSHTRDEIFRDLVTCREITNEGTQSATGAKVATGLAPIIGGSIQGIAAEEAYGQCMAPRGYKVTRWEPRR